MRNNKTLLATSWNHLILFWRSSSNEWTERQETMYPSQSPKSTVFNILTETARWSIRWARGVRIVDRKVGMERLANNSTTYATDSTRCLYWRCIKTKTCHWNSNSISRVRTGPLLSRRCQTRLMRAWVGLLVDIIATLHTSLNARINSAVMSSWTKKGRRWGIQEASIRWWTRWVLFRMRAVVTICSHLSCSATIRSRLLAQASLNDSLWLWIQQWNHSVRTSLSKKKPQNTTVSNTAYNG